MHREPPFAMVSMDPCSLLDQPGGRLLAAQALTLAGASGAAASSQVAYVRNTPEERKVLDQVAELLAQAAFEQLPQEAQQKWMALADPFSSGGEKTLGGVLRATRRANDLRGSGGSGCEHRRASDSSRVRLFPAAGAE